MANACGVEVVGIFRPKMPVAVSPQTTRLHHEQSARTENRTIEQASCLNRPRTPTLPPHSLQLAGTAEEGWAAYRIQTPYSMERQLRMPSAPRNGDLLLPYLVPYGAYVGVATIGSGLSEEVDYALRILITALSLLFLRNRFQRISGPNSKLASVAVGVVAGVFGVLLWVALLVPFQDPSAGEPFTMVAFLLRLAAATLVVPLAEELLFRGYVLGIVTQWRTAQIARESDPIGVTLDKLSVHEIAPGAWTVVAVLVSSAAFAMGHGPAQWVAAFGYGILMAGLWIARGDLLTPITAHAVTNLVLYLYVFNTEQWGLW